MYYYEVLPASSSYHGQTALTYCSNEHLSIGAIVGVPLRQRLILAIVRTEVSKPAFSAKPVKQVYDLSPLPAQTIKLLEWMSNYYPGPLGVLVQQFLPKSLSNLQDKLQSNTKIKQKSAILPTLTAEQKKVCAAIGANGSYLLHGETGSGKTRVYLELAARTLGAGRSAIILTPEISLTSQLANQFEAAFPGQIVITHSHLTDRERRQLWLYILATTTKPLVVVGPRSALFSPLKDLGLIVVDEAHENAYKQEQQPYYHALRVAAKLAQLSKAPLVLGSATPTISEYFMATTKAIPVLRMTNSAVAPTSSAAIVEVVDIKNRAHFTRAAHLSNQLLAAIAAALEQNEQTLLFLNRRGSARVVLCQVCGWQSQCPRCDLALTYHGDDHSMRCHTCGHRAQTPSACPICGSTDIIFKGIGTKAVADEIQRLFPKARVKRFDTDNPKAEQFERLYDQVKAGQIDILVGTQTIAKGLDLPRLKVVGVICADSSLYMPDYTAGERTFQLLSQVIGRVGRGHRDGVAIVQTYAPDSPVIRTALARDWQTFYETELAERQTYLFPPFCHLLKLTTRRANQQRAEVAARDTAQKLRALGRQVQIIGPTPAFHEKIAGKYQWQLVAKAKQRGELLELIKALPANWTYDIDPTDLL